MQYYSAMERNEVQIHAIMGMNFYFKIFCYGKAINHKRPYTVLFHLFEGSIISKSIETESSGCPGLRECWREMGVTA